MRTVAPKPAKPAPRRPQEAPKGKGPGKAKGRAKATAAVQSTFLLLVVVVVALNVIGLVMVLSASSVQSLREFGSTWSYFIRQATWLGLASGALVVTMSLDYRIWRRLSPVLLVGSAFALLAVLVPGIGLEVNGARAWIGVGSFTVQPSELAKLALVLFLADLLTRRAGAMHDSRLTLRPALLVSGVFVGLMMLQPDLGGTMVMASLIFAVLFVAGVPLLQLGAVTVLGSACAVVLALGKDYRRRRLLAFLDPSADPSGIGYQINQSLMGVSSGRLTGVGLGASRAKWGFLPNAHTDFIFAILSEELGLFGGALVVGLFVAFAVLGTRAAVRAPDRFGTLVAAGLTAWVMAQAFVNIGGVVGILPITGLTLPFVSFGGTSLIVSMAATGILLNIARHGR